jgi:hypothetical protein
MTMTGQAQATDPCPQVPKAFVDPTRIAKLARELKTKQAARQEAVGETEAPEEVEQVLGAEGQAVPWKPP